MYEVKMCPELCTYPSKTLYNIISIYKLHKIQFTVEDIQNPIRYYVYDQAN